MANLYVIVVSKIGSIGAAHVVNCEELYSASRSTLMVVGGHNSFTDLQNVQNVAKQIWLELPARVYN